MLPRADLNIHPVGRADAIARLDSVTDPRQEAFHRSMASLLGKALQGDVLSKLTDGSYLVKLAGTSARMQLPAGTEVGHQLPLTLISLTPRPTFQLANQAALLHAEAGPPLPGGAPEPKPGAGARAQPEPLLAGQAGSGAATHSLLHAATLLGKAPLTPSALLPALDPGSTAASLSETAKAISGVLTLALSSAHGQDSIVARTPLSAAPGAPPAQLAEALNKAIERSGLFYESHVAQWSNGARALTELAQEPQMQRAAAAATPEAALRLLAPASDPATAQLINLQLQTQEQARVAWQGQAWPGQEMRWEVQRDDAQQRPAGEDAPTEPAWRSGLRLRLPLLGEIDATVVMLGNQCQIEIQAGSSELGALLRAHAATLAASMEAAGTALTALSIGVLPAAEPDV
jgi:hypothetical protein